MASETNFDDTPRRLIKAQNFNFERSLDFSKVFENDDNNNLTPKRRLTISQDLLHDCDKFSFTFEEQVSQQQVSLQLLLDMKQSSSLSEVSDSCYASRSGGENAFSYTDSEDSRSCKSMEMEQDTDSMLNHSNTESTTSQDSWEDDRTNVLGIEYYESEIDELSSLNQSECSPSKGHIDTRSILEAMCRKLDPDHQFTRCSVHKSTPVVLFCETCSLPICLLCKLETHTEHKFTTLKAASSMCQRKLRQNQRRLSRKVAQSESTLQEICQYQVDIKKQRLLVEQKLKKQRDYLHEKIDLEYNKLMMQVDSVWGQEMMFTDSKIDSITKLLHENKQHLQKIEELLSLSIDTLQLLDQCQDIIKLAGLTDQDDKPNKKAAYEYLDLMTPTRPQSQKKEVFQRQYFILGQGADITTSHLGTFNTGYINSQSLRNCLVSCGKQLFSFTTRGLQKVTHMATNINMTRDGNFLITDLGLDAVRCFDIQGHRKFTLNTLPLDEPSSAIMLDNNSFMVACKNGLKLFNQNGEFERKVQTSAEIPQGLALNKGGDIIVTDRQSSSSLIHIFARADFRRLHTIIGGNRAPLFTQAWYVAVDHDNNLIISDSMDHTVKVLSSFGMLMYEFGGKGCQPGQFFHPAGVCVDAYGHILVADLCNNRIQMFSQTGEFLAVIMSAENDLESPMDLDIDPKGNLVVLQGDGEVKVIQYIY